MAKNEHVENKKFTGTKVVSLSNDTLNGAREAFDQFLQNTIARMKAKNLEDATVSLKLTVKLTKITEPTGDDESQEVYIPKFDYKVTSSYQERTEQSGSFGGADYELTTLRDGSFGMRVATNGQMTLDL